jgi:hypothetical protein
VDGAYVDSIASRASRANRSDKSRGSAVVAIAVALQFGGDCPSTIDRGGIISA